MCGIVGYVGKRPCRDLIVAGLEKLEYRGYDSAGISLLSDGHIDSVRAVGNLANLREAVGLVADQPVSTIGEGALAVAAPPATEPAPIVAGRRGCCRRRARSYRGTGTRSRWRARSASPPSRSRRRGCPTAWSHRQGR